MEQSPHSPLRSRDGNGSVIRPSWTGSRSPQLIRRPEPANGLGDEPGTQPSVVQRKHRPWLLIVASILAGAGLLIFWQRQHRENVATNNNIHVIAASESGNRAMTNRVRTDVDRLSKRQDAAESDIKTTNTQVNGLSGRMNRVEHHLRREDSAIDNLRKQMLQQKYGLPLDYNPKIPLVPRATAHTLAPSVQDWSLKVDSKLGSQVDVEVAPVRVTKMGTEVYVMKSSMLAPLQAGKYYLINRAGKITPAS